MPLYDYRCVACGREVEVMHGIHDGGPAACEACGGAMRKALSPPAIHFKGSGWAKKDARASTASKAKPKASPESSSSESSGHGEGAKSDASDKSPSSEKAGAGAKASSTSDASG